MADVTIQDGGSIVLLKPESEAAESWLNENIGEDNGFQPYWPTVTVERRYVQEIIDGMIGYGLEVS